MFFFSAEKEIILIREGTFEVFAGDIEDGLDLAVDGLGPLVPRVARSGALGAEHEHFFVPDRPAPHEIYSQNYLKKNESFSSCSFSLAPLEPSLLAKSRESRAPGS